MLLNCSSWFSGNFIILTLFQFLERISQEIWVFNNFVQLLYWKQIFFYLEQTDRNVGATKSTTEKNCLYKKPNPGSAMVWKIPSFCNTMPQNQCILQVDFWSLHNHNLNILECSMPHNGKAGHRRQMLRQSVLTVRLNKLWSVTLPLYCYICHISATIISCQNLILTPWNKILVFLRVSIQ